MSANHDNEKINPVIPPQEGVVYWYAQTPRDQQDYPRNSAFDRQQRKKESIYYLRSLAETASFLFKTIHGSSFFSRKFENLQKETDMKIKPINIMTSQGMHVSKPEITA